MSVERSGQAIHDETLKGQLATGGARGFGARAAALDGWYEPDESRGSSPEFCEGLGVKFDGSRKEHMELLSTVPLLIIDDLGMRKLGPTAAEELLEIVMRRYERTSTPVTSNRPIEDWGKLLGDTAAVTAMLDCLLHHGHILKCGPRSWRTRSQTEPSAPEKP